MIMRPSVSCDCSLSSWKRERELCRMKIFEMGPEERPREKMLLRGAESLSNSELLAILLRTGGKDMNVVDLSRTVINAGGGTLVGLSSMSVEKMMQIPGIGRDKAATIIAAIELGRRFVTERSGVEKVSVRDASMVYNLMYPRLKGLSREECWALYLNRAGFVISKERICIGDLSSTIVDTKKISIDAMNRQAVGVILVHNHPSGDAKSGKEDEAATSALRKALNTLGIRLLDHVIIGDGCYYSFADGCMTSL